MEEKIVKTSWKQRLIIGIIAFLLLGSSIAVYAAIVLGGDVDYSKMTATQLERAYEETYTKYQEKKNELSSKYYDEFVAYKSNVKGYNKTTANSDGVTHKDLKEGTGEEISNNNYSAYYIGWCSDESIFDSSFDNYEEPTSLKAPIAIEENNLIEGWYMGTSGMKLEGIREITVPGSLAYGDSQEICGSKNSPLKFIIMAVPKSAELEELTTKLNNIYMAMSNAYAQSYSNYSDGTDYSYSEAEEVTTDGE